jgi:biopolymer transport protein ExbB
MPTTRSLAMTSLNRFAAGALCTLIGLTASLIVSPAQAQITDAWKNKSHWVLDTTDAGAGVKSAQAQFVVPLRLHTGNFDFTTAKRDGSDLRVVAADGKTILPHRIEYFDAANELAVVWVRVPTLAPSNAEPSIWLYSANPDAPDPTPVVVRDGVTVLALNAIATPANEQLDGVNVATPGAQAGTQGLLGESIGLPAGARIEANGAPIAIGPDGLTASFWVRAKAAGASSPLLTLKGAQSSIAVSLAAGMPSLKVTGPGVPAGGGTAAGTAAMPAAEWRHVTLVIGERTALFVDGNEVASVAARLPAEPVQLALGGNSDFDVDALSLSKVARSPDWIRATAAAQGPDNKMASIAAEAEDGEASHFRILVDNLTLDGKIVIYILLFMLLVALWVMISKALQLSKVAKVNQQFLAAFKDAPPEAFLEKTFGAASTGASAVNSKYEQSSLYRMFETAGAELRKRHDGGSKGGPNTGLNSRGLTSIRAAIDATLVREGQRLNRLMVLLTIAISGGPFIGLLGTVVGVMITFAAIAAAGDVNINSIAPGIAAALLATVAGLAVAIPALFAYNWFASRIKEMSNEMQIFADELTSRIAERFES